MRRNSPTETDTDLAELALSTMWFQRWRDQSDVSPFFEQGRQMGFRQFELSHILSPEAVATAYGQPVTAVHHPCPSPSDSTPGFTAPDSDDVLRARRLLDVTLDTAARVGAQAVVLHLGTAPDPSGRVGRLHFEAVSRRRFGDSGWRTTAAALRDLVGSIEEPNLLRAAEALRPALRRAADLGLDLAWETGYHPYDLPTSSGAAWLAQHLPELRPWLDTGHVAAREHLMGMGLGAWSAAVGGQWRGAHLHDAVGFRDHLPPGRGHVDFGAVVQALPRDAALTLEVDWYFSPEEVEAGRQHLERVVLSAAEQRSSRTPNR